MCAFVCVQYKIIVDVKWHQTINKWLKNETTAAHSFVNWHLYTATIDVARNTTDFINKRLQETNKLRNKKRENNQKLSPQMMKSMKLIRATFHLDRTHTHACFFFRIVPPRQTFINRNELKRHFGLLACGTISMRQKRKWKGCAHKAYDLYIKYQQQSDIDGIIEFLRENDEPKTDLNRCLYSF